MNETNAWSATPTSPEPLAEELDRLHEKLDRVMAAMALLDRRRDDLEEMLADLLPAANGAIRVATNQLWELERTGTIGLARETLGALEDASRAIDPDDLRALGGGAGRAVRTLRTLTGPEVEAVAQRTVGALRKARTGRPPGFFALWRRLRQPHVRRGLGAALDIVEALGEGAHPETAAPVPAARSAGPVPTRRIAAVPAPTGASPPPKIAAPADLEVEGRTVTLDADGFLVDPRDWTPAVAEALAARAGLPGLTDEHWKVLDFCRADAQQTGGAPGLRRITKQLDIPPGDMYRLFPKGPGTLAARLAGLYKPKSCV